MQMKRKRIQRPSQNHKPLLRIIAPFNPLLQLIHPLAHNIIRQIFKQPPAQQTVGNQHIRLRDVQHRVMQTLQPILPWRQRCRVGVKIKAYTTATQPKQALQLLVVPRSGDEAGWETGARVNVLCLPGDRLGLEGWVVLKVGVVCFEACAGVEVAVVTVGAVLV